MFVDYYFDVLDNGTIIMDRELTAKQLNVQHGDKYVVNVTFDGRIVFQKVQENVQRPQN